ncbi:MAG TPA: hypothetical protein VMS01_18350, partial [Stellaceae bacterium]|nr:hypothetical protein [Stellaceae bacterium]
WSSAAMKPFFPEICAVILSSAMIVIPASDRDVTGHPPGLDQNAIERVNSGTAFKTAQFSSCLMNAAARLAALARKLCHFAIPA